MKRSFTVSALAVLALAASGPTLARDNLAATGKRAFAMAKPAAPATARSKDMQIYWIDTEGGAATLIVTAAGESLLIDTGYPDADRDAKRIFAAAQDAGLKKIDHVLISHFHRDHEGGLAALAKMIPIGKFYDHGDTVDEVDRGRLDDYKAVAGSKRKIVKPGDKIALKGGVEALIVTSDAKLLTKPVNGGAANPLCADSQQMEPAGGENQRGVSLLLSYNKFSYLNTIDLDWAKEMELACPLNKVGRVSVYQTGRHGGFDGAGAPALLGAIQPQVVVVNNGPRKGLGARDDRMKPVVISGKQFAPYEKVAYQRLAKLPGIEGIWQGHLSLLDKDPAHNTPEDMVANFEETADCKGHWIKASVGSDGKFTMTNGRNGFSKTYMARGAKVRTSHSH
jgi:competence protein ComEC